MLGLGNYINGDTARGQAYGLKPDVLSKLQLMKANNASNGTLLNFLALEVVRYKPKLKDFTSDWVATWAAADVPFKQLVTDVTALEKQLTVCKNEFDRIKEGNENIGLDNQLENVKGRLTEPLHRRLKMFLNFAVPRLQSIKSQTKATETSIESLIRL